MIFLRKPQQERLTLFPQRLKSAQRGFSYGEIPLKKWVTSHSGNDAPPNLCGGERGLQISWEFAKKVNGILVKRYLSDSIANFPAQNWNVLSINNVFVSAKAILCVG